MSSGLFHFAILVTKCWSGGENTIDGRYDVVDGDVSDARGVAVHFAFVAGAGLAVEMFVNDFVRSVGPRVPVVAV